MEITYEQLLALNDLSGFDPDQIVNILGIIFETGRENQSKEGIKVGLSFSEKQDLSSFSTHDKMIFHYNVSNGWSYLQILNHHPDPNVLWAMEFEELEKQIIHLRFALKYSKEVRDDFNKCQILTNLGNLFNHIGRFSEAQFYWKQALKIDSKFPMAIGNIGFGTSHYARALYDDGHKSLFLKLSFKYLTDAVKLDMYDEAKSAFESSIKTLISHFGEQYLVDIPNLSNFKIGGGENEKRYRKWCLNMQLFLNPLNDLTTENIASHDCLHLPSLIVNLKAPPIYHTIFNQIKQEYATARFLLYEGLNNKRTHFSDKDNLLIDTFDYSLYSYSCEKVKIAFRICYSILDKISYLLNDYLELGLKPSNVSFRNIWFEVSKNSQRPLEISRKIMSTQNWAFRGLYWLSKDFFEKETSFLLAIEPEAKQLAEIRNFIEHKSFKLVEMGSNEIADNGLTYIIQRDDFEEKTLKLFRLVRSAIIYLSLGINLEESKKDVSHLVIPFPMFEIKDKFKV